MSTYGLLYDARYVLTWVDPPARSYQMSVPPGDYDVVARFDRDPLSAAGHLVCPSINCGPTMTRAGLVTCRTADCQPVLAAVHVDAGQGVTAIDVGGWGSLNALDVLWNVDQHGAPGPITRERPTPGATPSSPAQVPVRLMPPASSDALPVEFGLPYEYDLNEMIGRIDLPAGWRQVANPARAVDSISTVDFSNQAVRSPLALGDGGIWLNVQTHYYSCWPVSLVGETATATVTTNQGPATFYFEDPHSAQGRQPYSGYALTGARSWGARGGCLVFRFTAPSEPVLDADLPSFLAIVEQAK